MNKLKTIKLVDVDLQLFAKKSYNGVDYDDKTDYAAKMNEAAAKGDYASAAKYEAQRNAKIAGEGLGYTQTNKYSSGSSSSSSKSSSSSSKSSSSSSKSSGASANYNSGNGYTNRQTAYTWNDNGKNITTYSNATRYEDALREAIAQGQLSTGAKLSQAVTYGTNTRIKDENGITHVGAGSAETGYGNIYSNLNAALDNSTGRNSYAEALGHMAMASSPSNSWNNGNYLDSYSGAMDDFYNYYNSLDAAGKDALYNNGTGTQSGDILTALRALENGYRPTGDSATTGSYSSTMAGYVPLGTHNDAGLSGGVLAEINAYKAEYAAAQQEYMATGSPEAKARMEAAHREAERLRAAYGYSGGLDGSDYIDLGYGMGNTAADNGFYWNVPKPSYDYDEPKPTYDSKYENSIDKLLNEILNREKFSYDVNTDPLYQQYKSQYLREGQRAMNDTLAAAAAGAGGMNSYAIMAAQQAQNNYASQLGDVIPELHQLAYNKYLNDIEQQVQNLGLLQQMDDTQYGRYRDTMNDWYNDRDFAYDYFRDAMGDYYEDKGFAYGQYRDDVGDSQWLQTFENEKGRDAIDDSRYESETAYSKAMEFLSMGIMPSADILAKAGISAAEAQAYINKVNTPKSTGGGGGDDDTKTSDTPKTGRGKLATDLGINPLNVNPVVGTKTAEEIKDAENVAKVQEMMKEVVPQIYDYNDNIAATVLLQKLEKGEITEEQYAELMQKMGLL